MIIIVARRCDGPLRVREMITMGMPPGCRRRWPSCGTTGGLRTASTWTGRWTARRRDGLGTLSAASAEELRRLIFADYPPARAQGPAVTGPGRPDLRLVPAGPASPIRCCGWPRSARRTRTS